MRTEAFIRELSERAEPVTPVERPAVGLARWAAAAGGCAAVGVAAFGVRPDLGAMVRNPTFVALAAVTLALAASSAFAALSLSVPGRARRGTVLVPAALLVAWLAVLGHAVVSAGALTPDVGLGCLTKILVVTLVPSALLYAALRRRAPLRTGAVGGLAALAALATGAFGSQFVCRHDDPLHTLLWHYLPVVVLAAVGALAGRRLFDWERRDGEL